MWRFNNALPLGLVALVLLCAAGWFLTRDAGLPRGAAKEPAAGSAFELIDQRLLQAAQQLASLADTHQEQVLAREALRLADHELDQALATALREAAASTPPPTGPLKQLADRIKQLKARLSADQEHIAKLAPKAAIDTAAAARLELAKAQQALDQDELEDAQQDLFRQGGDNHARLKRALQAHEAAQNAPEQPLKSVAAPQIDNLSEQVQVWISLGSRENHME